MAATDAGSVGSGEAPPMTLWALTIVILVAIWIAGSVVVALGAREILPREPRAR